MFDCGISSVDLHEGQFVVTKTTKLREGVVTVQLLEYEMKEGLIMPSELSRKRIKNASQATKIGKTEVCQIIKIEGGNIDLSLKQVDEKEKTEAMTQFKQNKLAYGIAEKAAKKLSLKTRAVYSKLKGRIEQYGELYNFLAAVKENTEIIDTGCDYERVLVEVITNEFKPEKVKIRADVDVNCYKSNGLAKIKEALAAGEAAEAEVEICLLNTPTFSITTTSNSKEEGFEKVRNVMDVIRSKIEESKGTFSIMSEPKIYGEKTKHNKLKFKETVSDDSNSSDSDE
ncbi:IF2A [Enterospora canceri]|uniref:IF2A n=1 Tax=Enterospora canceri TaxID=1081671 RepID=A0A1Y1S9Z7_9MICR|nr:IF2A [Enterospora canceri]